MPRGGATCGYPFKEGRAYLVYAYEKDPGFGVDLTVRTDAVTMAGVWIGDLNLARAIESRWIVLEGPRHLRWAFPDWHHILYSYWTASTMPLRAAERAGRRPAKTPMKRPARRAAIAGTLG